MGNHYRKSNGIRGNIMKKVYYMVVVFDNKLIYEFEETAVKCAESLSMSDFYTDTDIKVIKVEETKITTFRNGGEVA